MQDRLPKELVLAGITTVAAANAYLRTTYVAEHNDRFAVAAEQTGSAFVPVPGVDLREVLWHEEKRQVGNDNAVVLQTVRLQIPPSPLHAHYVKARCGCAAMPTAIMECSTGHAASAGMTRPGSRWRSRASKLLDEEDSTRRRVDPLNALDDPPRPKGSSRNRATYGVLDAPGSLASYQQSAAGSAAAALIVFIAGGVVVFAADHFVRPVLIGGATKLPFIWILLGILGGLEVWGLLGLFLGPAIMAALILLWREWTLAGAV